MALIMQLANCWYLGVAEKGSIYISLLKGDNIARDHMILVNKCNFFILRPEPFPMPSAKLRFNDKRDADTGSIFMENGRPVLRPRLSL
jgi:hypothetical protein